MFELFPLCFDVQFSLDVAEGAGYAVQESAEDSHFEDGYYIINMTIFIIVIFYYLVFPIIIINTYLLYSDNTP